MDENVERLMKYREQDRRIKRITVMIALQEYWHAFPELRLGQLISNAIPRNADLFYISDDDFLKCLEEFAMYQSEINPTLDK